MITQEALPFVRMRVVFTEEIAALGGTVSDTIHRDDRLYLRAVLPRYAEVGPLDHVQCGVALRADGRAAQVHPYVFRLVCENGAIQAHALETTRIDNLAARASEAAEKLLREAISACGSAQAFEVAAGEMRTARDAQADFAIQMMPLMARLPANAQLQMLEQVLDRFHVEGDMSRFGLMNAITATARETEDPELRWRLEEFGGGIPVAPNVPVRSGSAAASLPISWEEPRKENIEAKASRAYETVAA